MECKTCGLPNPRINPYCSCKHDNISMTHERRRTVTLGLTSAQGPLARTWTVKGVAWASVYVGEWDISVGVLVP